jgi:hypothetical protein
MDPEWVEWTDQQRQLYLAIQIVLEELGQTMPVRAIGKEEGGGGQKKAQT